MTPETTPFRAAHRWLAPVLLVLALACPAAATAAGWRLEPIAGSEGVLALHDLAFDTQGRGLLSWVAELRGRLPPAFGGLASRDPAGGWLRPPDLAGVEPGSAQIHLYGERALLVGREDEGGAVPGVPRRRLVTADGQSDGGFGPLLTLDDFTIASWSAVNRRGDAVVAWTGERSPFVRVALRAAGGQVFAAPRDLAIASSAAVAINARGDVVLAFTTGKRLAARVRSARGVWGPTVQFGRFASTKGMRLSALVTRDRRIVVTWGSERRSCGAAVRGSGDRWHVRRLERRCGVSAVARRGASVAPFADSGGATYVAWTGRNRRGRSAVKLARIDSDGVGRAAILSRQRGATLDDVAAGPGRALAVTWTAPRPTAEAPFVMASFASVRRSGGFGKAERLTPPSITVARGSRVAFQPLTGEPVVAVPYLLGFTVAVGAAVGQPAAPPPPAPP